LCGVYIEKKFFVLPCKIKLFVYVTRILTFKTLGVCVFHTLLGINSSYCTVMWLGFVVHRQSFSLR